MKGIVFKIFLCCFLAGAGQYIFAHAFRGNAGSIANHQTIADNHGKKLNAKDHSVTLIDDTEFDVEEDNVSGDDFKENKSHSFSLSDYIAHDKWHAAFTTASFLSDHSFKNSQTFEPFFGCTTPIYIIHRVLRI